VGEVVGLGVGEIVGEEVGNFVGLNVGGSVGKEVGDDVIAAVSFANNGSSSTYVTPISPSQTSAVSFEVQLFQPYGFDISQQFPVEMSITHRPSLVQVLTRPLHELLESPSHTTASELTAACRRARR